MFFKCVFIIALQQFLKTIIVTVVSQKSSFKTNAKHFIHGMGSPVPNPWLRNTAHISVPDGYVIVPLCLVSYLMNLFISPRKFINLLFFLRPTEILGIHEDTIDLRGGKREEDNMDPVHLMRLRETHEELEDRKALEAACSSQIARNPGPPITAWNLLSALQVGSPSQCDVYC